jgi:DNA polymerase sigma
MPFLRGNNSDAIRIHEMYQATNDQQLFLRSARQLIEQEEHRRANRDSVAPQSSSQALSQQQHLHQEQQNQQLSIRTNQPTTPSRHHVQSEAFTSQSAGTMYRVDPASLFGGQPHAPTTPSRVMTSGSAQHSPVPQSALDMLSSQMQATSVADDPIAMMHSIWGSSPITPPRHSHQPTNAASTRVAPQSDPSSPWALAPSADTGNRDDGCLMPSFLTTSPRLGQSDNILQPRNTDPSQSFPSVNSTPLSSNAPAAFRKAHTTPASNGQTVSTPPRPTPPSRSLTPPPSTQQRKPAAKYQPPRLWTHFKDQPGRLSVNGWDGHDPSLVLTFRPRQELLANWILPLKYIEQSNPNAKNLEQALKGLAVGLFRRGCADNATQAAIISKFVTERKDYGVDPASGTVHGKLPFFSPRTPGNVILRLYWHDDHLRTLATGPAILVQVQEQDFDSSVRFILSNFKGKKSNPTSLSSLLSLAQVLETSLTVSNDSAARAVWGCIQEARKVIDACYAEYVKTCGKLAELEEVVEGLKKQVQDDDEAKSASDGVSQDGTDDETLLLLREKTRSLMSGRASNVRKWRDSQLAFASILRAAVTNPSIAMMLRHDMIMKMRVEYELWCPLCEEFAVPEEGSKLWYDSLRNMPHNISADDLKAFAHQRHKMQQRVLAFEPNTSTLEDVLFPRRGADPKNQREMDAGAVEVLNNMSSAMGKYFRYLFADEERVVVVRETVRQKAEAIVTNSGAFPSGTRVVVFGSAANGFGSPRSDIDMCLILPHGHEFAKEDATGASAMGKLADCLRNSGMEDVDAARLTARIPIIRFFCPNPLSTGGEDDAKLIECDLSMHNPLAVLNTSLLRSYAEITPVTRVLAAIVKRWAKERDINNPARHTLSSYGYSIMLLHFLTYHKRSGNGLLVPIAPPEGNFAYRKNPNQQGLPILPNLQWVDAAWPSQPKGTPYRELPSLPQDLIPHPLEDDKTVNAYFYKPRSPNDKVNLQMMFPCQDLSLAILLASFFRYYAFEFDYKHHVVSLHSTATRGTVDREAKAEVDGWRNFSAALTIEDPFETSYDVAHVLRGGYYHRIRREFAVAYSKIADAASGRLGSWNKPNLQNMTGEELIDWICEPVSDENEAHAG